MSTTAPTQPREYILGTADDEATRLGFQHQLWADLAQQTWREARIAPGQTVLDVGCGPGFASLDLAQLVGPTGAVHAADESAPFLERLRQQAAARGISNIHAHQADAHALDSLPIHPGSIDLAYARWVLCFVRDPGAVVASVARLLKHGGRFTVNDYFNYECMTIAPRRPAFSRGIRAIGESWRSRGGDPDVVGRLPDLFAKAGLRVTHLRVDQRLAQPADTMWQWPESFWRNYIPRLVSGGFLTKAEGDAFMSDWRDVTANPNSFMALPPVYMLVGEKA